MTTAPRSARARQRQAAIALTAAITPVIVTGCSPVAGDPPIPTESSTESTQEVTELPDSPSYVDGEYSARGWYGSLPSHQDVTLTIEDGVVTDVDITTPAEDETSLGYQERFALALPDEIVGRPLDEIGVDRLAGASGCSEGFMDALAEIRGTARAGG
jgi:uncharacterized protein with FMN-binding domain